MQYGADFLTQFAPVRTSNQGRNGAFITSCICHGCPFSLDSMRLSNAHAHNRSAYQAFSVWYNTTFVLGGWSGGNPHVFVDTRMPDGGGELNATKGCVPYPGL